MYAILGQGTFLDGKKIEVNKETPSGDGVLLISDYYSNVPVSMDVQFEHIKSLQKTFLKTRHLGAACVDFASIAKKEALAYICYYSHIWDIAPGLLVATEAGCVYSYVDGSDYVYGTPGLALANNQETLDKIVSSFKAINK